VTSRCVLSDDKKSYKNQAIVKIVNLNFLQKRDALKKLLVALLFLPLIAFADDKSSPSVPAAQSEAASAELQTNKHYVNSNGQVVHSPTKTTSEKAPDGATVKCRYGSFSFSQHRSGISAEVKRKRRYICGSCTRTLDGSNSKYLHVHHKNGIKSDNSGSNLEVLCIGCHAEEPMHGHMKLLPECIEYIERISLGLI